MPARTPGPDEICIGVDENGCLVAYTTVVIPEVNALAIFTKGRTPTLAEVMEVFTPEYTARTVSMATPALDLESDDGR